MNVFHSCARWLLAAECIAAFSCAAYAQEASMTLEQALARARQRAPRTLAAQDQIREARGRLAGASVFLQENPVVEAMAGPRYSTGGDTTDYDVSIAQPLELGGRRRARIAGAQAGVDRETAASHSAVRQLLGDVSIAFVQALQPRSASVSRKRRATSPVNSCKVCSVVSMRAMCRSST